MLQLYSYFRSSAAFRVRIALNLKDLPYDIIPINLRQNEQKQEDYRSLNPLEAIPTLVHEGQVLTQSMAILEYLEEMYPHPPLLPGTPLEKARVRAFCHTIVADIHPLNNLRVLTYLTDTLHVTDEQKQAWYETWIHKGFAALETMVSEKDSFCFGQKITLAETCLIPQVYNALRFNCSLDPYPRLKAIYDQCITLPAFLEASPENQIDAPI